MKLWLIAAVTAAITVPGAPPLGPHMHYEIRITGIERKLTAAERLQRACDLTNGVSSRVQVQAKADPTLQLYLGLLQHMTCYKPKSN